MIIVSTALYALCIRKRHLSAISGGPAHVEKREVPVSATMDGKEQQSSASTEPKLSDNLFQPEAWNPNKR